MNAFLDLIAKGGPVMIPIIGLSVFLYERCFNLLLLLSAVRREANRRAASGSETVLKVRTRQSDVSEMFDQQRIVIRSMVAAAPLLGLLGTVTGMVNTFDSIASRIGERSMTGLAAGISQALITTETGLAVVIPAVLVLYYAHRQLQKVVQQLVERESVLLGRG